MADSEWSRAALAAVQAEARAGLRAKQQPASEQPSDSVFVPAVKRSFGGMVRGAGHVLDAVGADRVGQAMQQYGQEVVDANPVKYRLGDALEHPGGFLLETAGELVPTAVGMAIPGGLVAKGVEKLAPTLAARTFVPSVAPKLAFTGKEAAAGLGVGGASTLMETGEILGQQKEELGAYDPARAFGYGALAGALDVPFGAGKVITKGVAGTLKKGAEEATLKNVAKETAKTAIQEGAQEGVQTGLEMQGVQPEGFSRSMSTAEGIEDMFTSIVKGFLGGGMFGAYSGVSKYRGALEDQKRAVAEQTAEEQGKGEQAAKEVPPEVEQAAVTQEAAQVEPPSIYAVDSEGNVVSAEDFGTLEALRRMREAAPPTTEGYTVDQDTGPVPVQATQEEQQVAEALQRATELYAQGGEENVRKAVAARKRIIDALRRNGTPEANIPSLVPSEAELQNAQLAPAKLRKGMSVEEGTPEQFVMEIANGFKKFPTSLKRLVTETLAKVSSPTEAATELMRLSGDPSVKLNGRQRKTLDDLATELNRVTAQAEQAAPEVAATEAPKPEENAGSTKLEVANERDSEKIDAQAAGQKVGGATENVRPKAGTEVEPVGTRQGTRDGASQIQGEMNAVQERIAAQAPVGEAPRGSEEVGQGVSQPGQTTEAQGDAKTTIGKEELKRRQSSKDYPEYWAKKIGNKLFETEEGKTVPSEGTDTLHSILTLLRDPKTAKLNFKGAYGEQVNHALYGLVGEAEAVGVPTRDRTKVHNTAKEFLDYVANSGETWAKRVTSAKKQFANAQENLEKQETPPTPKVEAPAPKGPRLEEEAMQPSEPIIHVRDEKTGRMKRVTPEQYRAEHKKTEPKTKQDRKPQKERVAKGEDTFDQRVDALLDAIWAGHKVSFRNVYALPDQAKYDDAVRAGDVQAVIGLIKGHFKNNPELKRVFDWVSKNVGEVKITYTNKEMQDDVGHYVGAAYDPETHSIEVFNGGSNPVVLAHELTHAAFEKERQLVESYIGGNGPRTAAMERKRQAYEAIERQFVAFKKDMPHSKAYGLTDMAEFLAEVFSNPDFRAELQTKPSTPLWRRVVDAIAKFIGVKRDALDDLFQAAQVLAYRSPDAAFAPIDFKRVYHGDVFYGVREQAGAGKDWVDGIAKEALHSGSKISGAMYKHLLGVSSMHNIAETKTGRIIRDLLRVLGVKSEGVSSLWKSIEDTEALASQLNTESSVRNEPIYNWFNSQGKDIAEKTHSAMAEISLLGLSESEVIGLANGTFGYKDILSRHIAEAKLAGITHTDAMKANLKRTVDRLKANLVALGVQNTKARAVPKDVAEWTPFEIMHDMFEQTREVAVKNYRVMVRNLFFRYAGKTEDALKVLNTLSTATSAEDFTHTMADVESKIAKLNGLTAKQQEKMAKELAALHDMMDRAMSKPYVPITRKGEFFVSLVRPKESDTSFDTVEEFVRFESEAEMREAVAALSSDRATLDAQGVVIHSGRLTEFMHGKSVEGVRQLASVLTNKISAMDLDDAGKEMFDDLVQQTMLQLLPESSALKHMIHRKGVPGWKPEEQFQGYVRSIVQSNFRYANNRYLAEREFHLDAMKQAVRSMENADQDVRELTAQRAEAEKAGDTSGVATIDEKLGVYERAAPARVQASRILEEVTKRHFQQFVDVETPVTDMLRAFVNHWQLSLSPGYLIGNLTQPYVMTLPTLGARYGYAKTAKAMMNAYGTAWVVIRAIADHGLTSSVSHESIMEYLGKHKKLDASELVAVRHMLDSGKVEFTIAKALGVISHGQDIRTAKVTRALALGSHLTEVLNRVVTGVAAYELERARSGDTATAEKTALWAIDDTQYNYGRLNRGRYIGKHGVFGEYTPLFTMFQFFNISTLEKYIRTINRAIDKTGTYSAEEKAESKKAFAGMLLSSATIAGVFGMPLASLIGYAVSAVGGDDDDPLDAGMAAQTWLNSVFGPTGGYAITHGPLSALGLDLYTRVGQQDLLPYSRALTDYRSLKDMPAESFVRNISPFFSTILGVSQGLPRVMDWVEGDNSAGDAVIRALPAVLRGPATSLHGYHDIRGTEVPNENTAWESALQSLGINPAWRNRQFDLMMWNSEDQAKLYRRAKQIQTNLVHALDDGDQEDTAKWRQKAAEFAAKNPTMASLVSPGQMLKQINKDRAFYKMTGLGATVSPRRLNEVYGVAQQLGLGADEDEEE